MEMSKISPNKREVCCISTNKHTSCSLERADSSEYSAAQRHRRDKTSVRQQTRAFAQQTLDQPEPRDGLILRQEPWPCL